MGVADCWPGEGCSISTRKHLGENRSSALVKFNIDLGLAFDEREMILYLFF